ncbi:hypothetical protein AB833_30355 [Chromatiales bacterium (ex Bugula neritina AB1)]|nr:hypothetical protein AB833_30355 [Chromatiales bacterium (ex Bugula neritina AB1)]
MQFPIIYLHIPKTAGTSFRISAEHYFGPWNVLNDYGENSPNTSEDILNAFYSNNDIELLKSKGIEKKFLTGHFSLGKYREVFPQSPVVTFFREPVDRVISEYVHFSTHYGFEGGLADFYRKKHFQNRQARAMSGAAPMDIDFFGITEKYEESLRRFNNRYGTNFPMATLNQGNYTVGNQGVASDDEIAEIRELNSDDVAIYETALANFDKQDKSPHTVLLTAERYCGHLGGVRNEKMYGWTVDRLSEQPAQLKVSVNGEMRLSGVADIFREDIRRKGIHINGKCGFEIPLETLGTVAAGDRISVRTADDSYELPNSPMVMPAS